MIFKDALYRSSSGSTCFVELQYCRLPLLSPLGEILSADNIDFWKDDSLYIEDENEFCIRFSDVFFPAVRGDETLGAVDMYGINYFPGEAIRSVREKLLSMRGEDVDVLKKWLENAGNFNGFYILGL